MILKLDGELNSMDVSVHDGIAIEMLYILNYKTTIEHHLKVTLECILISFFVALVRLIYF